MFFRENFKDQNFSLIAIIMIINASMDYKLDEKGTFIITMFKF